jgi:mono/diheme cytochrome c family protein
MQNQTRTTAILIAMAIAMLPALSPARAADDAAATGATGMTPLERVKSTEKGKLENPLTLTPEIIAEGKELYQAKTCGACHGGNGSGIHCPSLINDAWVYGSDDDTIFRLVTLGSDELLKSGASRGDKEQIAGPMPGFGASIPDELELWKIIAYIRSLQPAAAAK